MNKPLGALALTVAMAAPFAVQPQALAQQVVIVNPGASRNWVQQQPTSFLTTEMAQVLPDGLAYVSVGGVAGPIAGAGSVLNYSRGFGNGGELDVAANLAITPAFAAGVGAGWKQQLLRGGATAVAVNGAVAVTGLGGGTAVGAQLGLPITFDAGLGHLTVQPRLVAANLAAAGGAGTLAQAAVGFNTPIADRLQLLAEVAPGTTFAGGFQVPVGAGVRFSPTATSHLDVTLGQLTTTTPFALGLGLVGVTGHIGF